MGEVLLDLNYEEDSKAEVDMNVVMTGGGKFVEIQGTAEEAVFTKKEMDELTKSRPKRNQGAHENSKEVSGRERIK